MTSKERKSAADGRQRAEIGLDGSPLLPRVSWREQKHSLRRSGKRRCGRDGPSGGRIRARVEAWPLGPLRRWMRIHSIHLPSPVVRRHRVVKRWGYFRQRPALSISWLSWRTEILHFPQPGPALNHLAILSRLLKGRVHLMRHALPSPSCNSPLRRQWNFIGPCSVIPDFFNVIGNQRVPFRLSLYYSRQLEGVFFFFSFFFSAVGLQQAQDVDHLLREANNVSLWQSQVVSHVYRSL